MIPKLIQRRGAQHLAEEEAADLLARDEAPALSAPPSLVEMIPESVARENLVFPINKSLWTSSYATFTAGLAAIALAACYRWVDVNGTPRRQQLTEPLVALGRNALLLFVLSGVLAKTLIYVKWPDASMSLGRSSPV